MYSTAALQSYIKSNFMNRFTNSRQEHDLLKMFNICWQKKACESKSKCTCVYGANLATERCSCTQGNMAWEKNRATRKKDPLRGSFVLCTFGVLPFHPPPPHTHLNRPCAPPNVPLMTGSKLYFESPCMDGMDHGWDLSYVGLFLCVFDALHLRCSPPN